MTIEARPGDTIHPIITGGTPNAEAGIEHGIRVLPAGTFVVALTGTGITEIVIDSETSNYQGTLTIPADVDADLEYEVVWDVAGDEATEELELTAASSETAAGPYRVTFTDLRPPARPDLPWRTLAVEEASTPSGTWTRLAEQELSPVDTNPLDPRERTITAESTLSRGWYRIVWEDAAGDQHVEDPRREDARRIPFVPVSDVAALLRARTRDANGNELGTFTDDGRTRPTAAEVETLIDFAAGDVIGNIDGPLPQNLREEARRLVALGAALLVEGSYFPEQAGGPGETVMDQYQRMYTAGVLRLRDATSGEASSETLSGGSFKVASPTRTAAEGALTNDWFPGTDCELLP